MMNLVTRLAESVTTLENRVNSGEGTSQRRENLGGQTGHNGGNNGGSYDILTKVEFLKFDGEDVQRGGGHAIRNVNHVMPNRPFEKLTQQGLEEKRAKHLCFYCDKKYSPGHKCSGQMYYLKVIACDKMFEEDEDCVLTEQGLMTVSTEPLTLQIQTLFDNFSKVFESPKEIPPLRSHDHTIPLLPNTTPINVRPYKHPPNQKDAIELMVKEMLEAGLIKDSQSSFSSPIVKVNKKDKSWRMYVDYRQLNRNTVKNKFPIPVLEELLDELMGQKCSQSWI
nr:reverse transcriptase [Tanacetum cinerariifolium]